MGLLLVWQKAITLHSQWRVEVVLKLGIVSGQRCNGATGDKYRLDRSCEGVLLLKHCRRATESRGVVNVGIVLGRSEALVQVCHGKRIISEGRLGRGAVDI